MRGINRWRIINMFNVSIFFYKSIWLLVVFTHFVLFQTPFLNVYAQIRNGWLKTRTSDSYSKSLRIAILLRIKMSYLKIIFIAKVVILRNRKNDGRLKRDKVYRVYWVWAYLTFTRLGILPERDEYTKILLTLQEDRIFKFEIRKTKHLEVGLRKLNQGNKYWRVLLAIYC